MRSVTKIILKLARKDRAVRRALLEEVARYERGEEVSLDELPEEFQEMNRNPPESVVRVRERMERQARKRKQVAKYRI